MTGTSTDVTSETLPREHMNTNGGDDIESSGKDVSHSSITLQVFLDEPFRYNSIMFDTKIVGANLSV